MYDANKKYQIEKIYPNNPIRTMVIGIAKDYTKLEAGSALRKDAKAMRINLTKMAIAGVGGNVNVIPAGADKNPDLISDNDLNAIIASQGKINLFFAEDTQDLLKAVKSALSYITTHQMQPSKWSLVQGPSLSDEESFSVFASNFRIRTDTQWEGYLSRFAMTEQGRDDLASEKVWDLDEKVLNERGHRNLRYWQSYGGSHILANPNAGTFESLLALTDDKMELNTAFNGSTAAYLLDWFQGYDRYQYGTKKKLNSMLADIGQYGMNIVSVPVPYDALPGYAEWAREKAAVAISDDVKIYVQTNDGLLHVVNPDSGAEEKAILPPPMLIPSRLATLKTEVVGDRMRWIEVAYDGEDEPKKESPSVRSNAAYLLDGPLVKNSLPTASDGSAWGSYLLGGMGRGGSGYYMMNVDDRTEPSLLWYREWIEDKLYALDKSDPYNVPQIVTTYPDEYGTSPGKFFGEMGFNPPKPIMGSTGEPGNMRNILVLTGGTQKGDIDLSKNGTYREGAVMMILDPLTGKVLRGFTGDSNIETPAAGNSGASGSAPLMGMMVSEPSFFLSKTDARYGPFLAGAVFAADNRGTVFTVPLEGKEDDGTIKPLNPNDWYARAVGSLQMSSEMGTSSKSYSMPYGVFPVQINNKLWVCGGTADVLTMKGSDGTGGHIVNENQYIFSFSPEYDIYEKADISRLQSEIVTRDEMKVLNMSGGDLLSAGDNYKGWIYRLRGENDDPNITKNRKEYVSTKPLVLGNVLLVATFVETDMVLGKSETYNKSLCRPEYRTNGQARLYALDIATGGATKWWGGDKFIELDGAKITGINVADDWLMVAFDKTNNDTEVPDTIGDGEMEMNRDDVMQNVYFTHLPGKGAKINLELGENVMLYWNRK
jgi:Tfp pilus tip-associated adhesin PilY1